MKITKEVVEYRLEKGETLRAIARSFGVTHQSLQQYRRKWGCEPLRRAARVGEAHHSWKGGSFIDGTNGYKMIASERNTNGLKYTAEHIAVAENSIGRRLESDEVVHHINGDKLDNRPENLFVCTRAEHRRLHAKLESIAFALLRSGVIQYTDGDYSLA